MRPVRPVIVPVGPSIAYVPLTRGLFALIDSDDAEEIGKHTWTAHSHCSGGPYYAKRGQRKDGKSHVIQMHRQIMGFPEGLQVDHINGNPLDNRKGSLRAATNAQNARNSRPKIHSSTGIKGVSRNRSGWVAHITFDWKTRHLGTFPSPESAHEAYCKAAIELHGEFARFA